MFLRLFLIFTLFPIIEIYILMKLGAHFGVLATLLLVIGTGFLGAFLARREGYRVVFQIKQELQKGNMPTGQMVDAVLIFISGIVLITPGLLTDIFGFIVLIPVTRRYIKEWIVRKIMQYRDYNYNRTQFIHRND